MSVFDEIVIKWGGVDYVVQPTLKLISGFEQQGVIIASLMQSIGREAPEITSLAIVAGGLLRSAGAEVTDEEVYQQIIHGTEAQISTLCIGVVQAITPGAPDPKKPLARSGKPKPTGKKKKRKN